MKGNMQQIRSLIGISFVAIVLAALPHSPVGAGAFPGHNGWIAYEAGGGIRAVNPLGSRDRLLEKQAQTPRWSPDGQKLAFISRESCLHIKTIQGTWSIGSAGHITIDSFPAWSYDSSRLAFVRTEQSGSGVQNAIFTVTSFGTNETNLTGWSSKSTFASPSWSPDGAQLVFEKRTNGKRELIIKNMRTGQTRAITMLSDDVDSHVSWSPNGKKLLYSDSRNEIYTIWPDGSHRTAISDGESYQAAWSPDGTQIAFIENPEDDTISVSGPDGSISYIHIAKGAYRTISFPDWSPDGRRLLFTMQINRHNKTASDLFVTDVQHSGQLQKLAEDVGHDKSWQPIR